MGMMLGKISVETPKYELLHSCPDYEIRLYSPSVVAEVTYNPSDVGGNRDGGFTLLANYIGALGNPQNHRPEKIAMTAPVITTTAAAEQQQAREDAEMSSVTMQFVLPSKYEKAEDAPKPVDERVVIREEGERKYGVVRFSGVASVDGKVVEEKGRRLRECLERDGHIIAAAAAAAAAAAGRGGGLLLGRYNPPWTLPPLRTNEVMLPIA